MSLRLFAGQGEETERASRLLVHELKARAGRLQEEQEQRGDGVFQHQLNSRLGKSDGDDRYAATDVRVDIFGAHQHHQLDLLDVVVLPLEQKEMDVVGVVRSEFYGGSAAGPQNDGCLG